MKELVQEIGRFGVLPVISLENAQDAVGLGNALLEGGLPFAEITFRTDAAEDAIETLVKRVPRICVGAGSVLSVIQAERAAAVGAQFIVSPGFEPAIVDWCLEKNITCFPGVATPTEIMMGLKKNLEILKFFPAGDFGGLKTMKSIAAPFPGVRFIPTGGVSASNLEEYLRSPVVYAVGGSWLVSKKLINEKKFDQITILTREAMVIVDKVRGEP